MPKHFIHFTDIVKFTVNIKYGKAFKDAENKRDEILFKFWRFA